MKIKHHVALSTVTSGVLFAVFKSWELSIASFITGIFIDIDHLFDYVAERGFCVNVNEFLSYFYKEKHQKIKLIFHGWEHLIIIGLVSILTNFNPAVTGVFIGYGHHMFADYLYSKAYFSSYSFFLEVGKKI